MNELVFIEPVNKQMEPYTTDEIIAECAGVKRRTVQKLLLDKQEQLEAFGSLRFEIAKIVKNGSGNYLKTYHLNEQQATLLITFLRNTEAVTRFKVELVRQFFAMRTELETRHQMRLEGKPRRRALTDAIKDSGENERMKGRAHSNYTNLLYKSVTGMNASQLKERRGAHSMLAADLLTSDELKAYKRKEAVVTALLDEGYLYGDIKKIVQHGIAI